MRVNISYTHNLFLLYTRCDFGCAKGGRGGLRPNNYNHCAGKIQENVE